MAWRNPHVEFVLELPAEPKLPADLAPLFRMQAWQVPEIQVGNSVGVLGFTFSGEKGNAVLGGAYVFIGGKAYRQRSSPA